MPDIPNSPMSGLSFCTKGGKLLAQERSNASRTASQPQTPATNNEQKEKLKRRHLGQLPMHTLIYKVVENAE